MANEPRDFFKSLYLLSKNVYGPRPIKQNDADFGNDKILALFRNNYSIELKKYKFDSLNDEELEIFLWILSHNIYNLESIGMDHLLKHKLKDKLYKLKYFGSEMPLIKNSILKISHGNHIRVKVNQDIINKITGTDIIKLGERRSIPLFPHKNNSLLIKKQSQIDMENDIILTEENKKKIMEGIAIYKKFDIIRNKWKEVNSLDELKRLVFLFYGAPGTGKTMTSYGIANYLNMPLYMVNIAATQSKWVGDNEKLIRNIFKEFSKKKKGVLLFDEADSLFGSRIKNVNTPVGNMHNRVLNILLQEIEKTKKIVILTSNFAVNFDEAFQRRITYKIEFKPPSFELRKRLWEVHLPKNLPMEKNIDLDKLSEYELTGAEIKLVCENVLRNIAFRITEGGNEKIMLQDFISAIEDEREYSIKNKSIGFSV